MPTLIALSMNHDRSIVSRIRETSDSDTSTARCDPPLDAPARYARTGSRRSWLAAFFGVLALAGGANVACASTPASASLAAATDALAAAYRAYPCVAIAV